MLTTSYNGWAASPLPGNIRVTPFAVAGVPLPGGVKAGHVSVVFRYVAEQFHQRVEHLSADLGCWGYAYRQNRNADNLSCHASGTAIDLNAVRHPNGQRDTFSLAQRAQIQAILAEVDHVVAWGGDFSGTPDEMHFEIKGSAVQVAAVSTRLSRPIPAPKDDDMTPEQDTRLKHIEQLLEALVAPRRADHKDRDPGAIDLGDILTAGEKDA